MHSTFVVYLQLGFNHIADLRGYDHILFIVALSAGYALSHWKQLLILVTAFTAGHSITLVLATLRLVSVSSAWVEFLIPATITATGIFNLVESWGSESDQDPSTRTRRVKYSMALFFGLIHGLGFSTFLRAMLGGEEALALPLFSFNVGLELGQIGILMVILAVGAGVTRTTLVGPVLWTRILSAGTALAATALMVERIPFL